MFPYYPSLKKERRQEMGLNIFWYFVNIFIESGLMTKSSHKNKKSPKSIYHEKHFWQKMNVRHPMGKNEHWKNIEKLVQKSNVIFCQ